MAARFYDPQTLSQLVATIEKNISSTDPRVISALSVMVEAVGHSGESAHRAKLDSLSKQAQHPKLLKHFEIAIRSLSQDVELEEEEEPEEPDA